MQINQCQDMHPLFDELDPRVDLQQLAEQMGFQARIITSNGDQSLAEWAASHALPDQYQYAGKFLCEGRPAVLGVKPLNQTAMSSWLHGNQRRGVQ